MFWWCKKGADYYDKVKNGGLDVNLVGRKIGNKEATQIVKALMDLDTKVQTLSLHDSTIGEEGATVIAEALFFKLTLHTLHLSYNNINDLGAMAIAEALEFNWTLQRLRLVGNYIGVDGAMAIANALKINSTLQQLDLSTNHIGVDGAMAISNALKINSTLHQLDLSINQVGVDGAMAIAGALKINSTLQSLRLAGNNIRGDGAGAIALALEFNLTVQQLDLSSNSIGVDGATVIAEALSTNSTLQGIHLGGNEIINTTAIAEALKTNSTLQGLWLSWNNIGDAGASAIANALEINSALQRLRLDNNKIEKVGATAIANALKLNSTLQELGLSVNNIGNDGATAMAEALQYNSTLQRLNLDVNKIGEVGAKAIAKALNNCIGDDDDATAMSKALLKFNSTLQELGFYGNDIDRSLNSQIQSLLSKENREKRCLEQAPADPLEQKYPDPRRHDHAPSAQQVSKWPAVTCTTSPFQWQVGETKMSKESSSSTPMSDEAVQEVLTTDRTNIRKVLDDYEAEPVELSLEYFELALRKKVSLGDGSFGEVVRFKDVDLGKLFAVKTMRFELDDEQREFVRKTFGSEIQMLQQFRHPNIVRMYGFYLSTQDVGGTQYLLFESTSRGTLESMLKTEEGRKVLTFPRRIGILLGVAQGLNFLHSGIPQYSAAEKQKEPTYHRDVKSANISITSTFGAKLFDCGIGKLVAKDSKVLESFVENAQRSSGGVPYETPAYLDPSYVEGDDECGSFCDVFSFGVVVAEVFTGTLSVIGSKTTEGSGGGNAVDTRTVHRKYVHVSEERRDLRMVHDNLISDASKELLDKLSSISLECMRQQTDERPSACQIMVKLQEMILQVQCGETWKRPDLGVTGCAGDPDGELCSLCYKQTTFGLSCSDHIICAEHLPSHRGIESGDYPLMCMIEGCSKCYREDDAQKCLPAAMYKHYVFRQRLNVRYMHALENMYGDEVSNCVDGKIDVALEGIRYLRRHSDRALAALAHLVTGEQTPCPKLVWIVPQKRIRRLGEKGRNDRFKDAFHQETAVYFLCEDTYKKGHEDPIIMNFGREWVKHLLPLVKLTLLTLKMAGAVTSLPFPIPGVDQLKQFQYLDNYVTVALEHDECMRETLEDMEVWFRDIVKKGESMMEGDRVARIKSLIGSSYEMLSQNALKGENLPKWQHSMTALIVHDDNGNKCMIQWVKL